MVLRLNGADARIALLSSIVASHLGVDAVHEPTFDRLRLRNDDRLQSRLDKNRAPKHMVERYANQMGESQFPPIIITRDGLIIDGNTRNAAHAKRNDRYISALIVPIDYLTADEALQEKLVNLSRALNNMNGLPLDDDERRMYAYGMMREHASDEEIVTRVGLSLTKIRELREQYRGSERLVSLGVDLHELPNGAVLRSFGRAKTESLDDNLVQSVYQLHVDTGSMGAAEINSLVASLVSAGSEELRTDRLTRERQSRAEQIASNQSGQRIICLAGKLAGRLDVLDDHPLTVFVENHEERRDEYLQALVRHRDQLTEIIALQTTANATAMPAAVVAADAPAAETTVQ